MINLIVVGAVLAIFNRIQKLNIRPVFVRVRANNNNRRFN
jgi:hypothetical protein